ncbi:MAG: hypothetical protein ACRDK7_07670 [Solirubrobacteraceae bacterium]
MAKGAKGDDAGKSAKQPAVGVESGLSERSSLKGCEGNLASTVSEEDAKPKPRGQTSAGGGFKWG